MNEPGVSRFNVERDINLLKECQVQMIWTGSYREKAEKWKKIHAQVGTWTTVATLQNRYQKLLNAHISDECKSIRR